jgi:hypothetical protein
VAELEPGEHLFIVWTTEAVEALKATVAPGKTYFVEVTAKMGAFVARASLWAVTPRSDSWKERKSWEKLPLLEPDAKKGQAYLDSLRGDLQDAVKRGIKTYEDYSEEEKADATLNPEDGI